MITGWFSGFIRQLFGVTLYRKRSGLTALVAAQQEQIHQQQEQIARMNVLLEIKMLQARLNPHFLFNSLNSIQYFISGNDKKTALLYMNRFAIFLRKMIRYGDEVEITLQDEVELIKDYLVLEKFRFPDRFDFEVKVADENILETVPPFLTHSLLENALYNGVLHLEKEEKGMISVNIISNVQGLTLEVTDNGLPVTAGRDEDGRAELFRERIRRFNELQDRQVYLTQRNRITENGQTYNRAVITIR